MMSRSQTEKDLQGEQPRWGWGISWCEGLVGMEKRRIEVRGGGEAPLVQGHMGFCCHAAEFELYYKYNGKPGNTDLIYF